MPCVINKENILKFLSETPARYFELEEHSVEHYSASTRNNGDIGSETPGNADIQAAHEAAKILRKKIHSAHISVEIVDEWVSLDIILPRKFAIPEKQRHTALEACRNILLNEAKKLGIEPSPNNPDDFSEAILLGEPKLASCGYSESILIKFSPIYVNYEEGNSLTTHDPKDREISEWMPLDVKLTIFEQYGKEFVSLSLVGSQHKEEKEITHDVGFKRTCGQVAKLFFSKLQKENHLRTDLWKEIAAQTPIPQGSILVGHGGYEEKWENCPFYKTPSGDYHYIDGTYKEKPCHWVISKDAFKLSTELLATGFFPAVAEGSRPLWAVIREITSKIESKISQEAELGESQTLLAHGHKGKIVKAEDGSLHFLEA